jgi:hypothetical protein
MNMNQIEPSTSGTLVNTTPLFASVWLALFYVVRNNISERRLAATVNTNKLERMEKK